jgi:hypothetical protein
MSDSQKPRGVTPPGRSKTFCALNLFKWVAMLLMFGIAFGEFYMSGGDDINWIFIGFCVIFGLILLWTGHILAKHSIEADEAQLRRRKGQQRVRGSRSQ